MPTQSNKGNDFDRVWKVTDYGNIDALLRLSAGGMGGASVAIGADGRTLFPEGMPTGISTVMENGKIAATPAVKSAAQDILNDPKAFVDKNADPKAVEAAESLFDKGKSFLGKLFDTSDTWEDGKFKGAETPVESAWDSFLTGLKWGYDRISQVTVAGMSALPGGTRTLTWDEANDVSFGQQAIANIGVSTGDIRRGEGNIGDALALALSGPLGAVGFLAPDSATQQEGFDISSAEDRKAFESGWEKFGSGSLDAAFTILADPFIVGGKVLKITRLKYIDRPLTEKNVQAISKEVIDGEAYFASGEISKAAPVAQLVAESITRRADGSRMPTRELLMRGEISWGDNAEGIADALTTLPDNSYNLAGLVVRAGLGETEALQQLSRQSMIASDTLINARRNQLQQYVIQNPGVNYPRYTNRIKRQSDNAYKVLEIQKERLAAGTGSADAVAAAQKAFDDTVDDLIAIQDGVLKDGLASPGKDSMQLVATMVKEAEQNNEWFAKVVSDARLETSDIATSLSGGYKGFATDTAVGRFVSKRRAKKARAAYERVSTSGQGVRSTDFFGANRFQRTMRVWKRMSDFTPSYYVNFAAPIDQGREVGAILDTLGYLSGAAKPVVNKAGETINVGGIARKDELFTMYTSARSLGDNVADAMIRIQDEIRNDLCDYYNFDREIGEALSQRAFREQDKLKQQIQTSPDGYFMSNENTELSSLNVAPFLNTQLSNGMYVLPWDTFETLLQNIQKGKITDYVSGSVQTKGQMAADIARGANEVFQDFWRPAVLFRLGYPQRNITEGIIRSMAFHGSVEPIAWAGKAAINSRANFRRVKKAEREFKKLQGSALAPDAARDAFDGLAFAQRELFDEQNWLLGARERLTAQEARVADANTVPVISFKNADFDSAPIISDDGAFQIMKKSVGPEASSATTATPLVFKKSPGGLYENDLGYGIRKESSTVRNTATYENETITAWGISLPTGEPVRQLFDTLGEAKAWASSHAARTSASAAPTQPTATKYVVNQLDPVDNATFIPSVGGRLFDSADEAAAAIEKAAADSFAGVRIPGPQFEKLYREGLKARSSKVTPEKSPTGVEYADIASIDSAMAKIDVETAAIRDRIDGFEGRPISDSLKGTKFQKWREESAANKNAEIEDSIAYEAHVNDLIQQGAIAIPENARRNLQLLRQIREENETFLAALERDDMFALTEYTNQAAARRVVDSGSKIAVTPGLVSESAFGNPIMREINWRNMSSDNTIKATISLRNQVGESILYSVKSKVYVDVLPNQGDAYWEGMSRMLQQYSMSPMGKMILRGDSDETIALWLLSPEQKALRETLDSAYAIALGKSAKDVGDRIGESLAKATGFTTQVRLGLEQITAGNKEVWKIMQAHSPSPAELKAMMKDMPNLSAVVGSTEIITGRNTVMNMWRKTTEAAFKQIGTKPEDAFVRGPFYAKRYEQARAEKLKVLFAQYSTVEDVPLGKIRMIEEASHRRALKDTKDFLYTIDRRTKLGQWGETMFPFISASQNSLTALGRLSYRDPSVLAAMALIWQAPTKVGWEDKDGNLIIPIPHDLIPDGVEDFFGIAGMKNATMPKSSFNVVFPESGFAFVPRPTPLVQAAASELMKNGLFGQMGVEAPPLVTAILGEKDGDRFWQVAKNYMYGEEGGISPELFSYDKLLPPIANKAIQYMQKDGSSQYGYQYALQARTQDLLWRAGARPDYPTPDEIMKRTNGMFILRMMGNAFAFTPPNYQSPIQPLLEIQRAYDEAYGIEGPMKFSENFGNETMILSDLNSTKNVGGVTTNPGTVRNIKKYDSLVRQVAGAVGDDLDVMGIIVNEDMANSFYDTNASRWMLQEDIPGTSRKWREIQSGGESMAESQRQAGWVEYIKFKGQLDSLLQQRGLATYSNKGAEDLNSYRKEFINNMIENPMYEGWAVDFQSTGSSKTYSAVRTLEAALNDDGFMKDHSDDRTWQIAAEYIDTRNRLIQMVKESGVTLENDINQTLKDQWIEYRQQLINRDIGWAGIANRYLNGDDNPTMVGASFMKEGL